MIYCPNFDCAKPRNEKRASFCSHCGTPLKVGDRFSLTDPFGEAGQSFFAIDQHLPSQPRRIITRRGALPEAAGWNQEQLKRLEHLGEQGHLPRLIAVVEGPQPKGRSTEPSQFFAHAWIDGTSLAQSLEQDGAIAEQTLRQHLTSVLADLVQIHDQGFVHGDIRPSTLIQQDKEQSGERHLWAASYREIAPICEATQPAQGRTQDLRRLQYWAPERKLGQAVPASDIYSLGVSAIRLLTAQPLEQLFDVAEDCWCWEESLETELSDDFCHLLNSMLERATRRRYSSAVDVLRDLTHLNELAELAALAEPIAPLQPSTFEADSEGADRKVEDAGAEKADLAIAGAEKACSETLDSARLDCVHLASGQSDSGQSGPGQLDPGQSGSEQTQEQELPAVQEPASEKTTAPLRESEIETLPLALETLQTASESKEIAHEQAKQSLAESLETLTDAPQAFGEPAPGPRRSRQNAGELVARVLDNPLTLSIGGLVQQLAQRHSAKGATYVPWEIMKALKQLKRSPETELTFARHLLEMANFYRDQVNQGHRDLRRLIVAIVSYEQALTILDHQHNQWLSVCHDLGRMYLNLSRQHPSYRVACIEQSVATFQRGLSQAEANNGVYLELQNQLGEAYGMLAASEKPTANWQGAIAAYQAALAVCPSEAPDPTGEADIERNECHGAIQNNLGTALWNLSLYDTGSGEASERLQGAIAAYQAALAHHDPDADPVRFGMIQNNLGTAYLNLAQSEKSLDLLRLAAGTYQVALLYRKRGEVPLAHAATQNNLGAASLQLASHHYADPQTQREALEQSIIAYEAALKLVCELSAAGAMSIGFDPAASRLNLALAHQRRGCAAESEQNSSVIFAHLETAMQIYLDLLEKQPQGSDIHEMALEYLSQTMHHLSEHLHIADDHPLLKQVPNHVVAEMSQQFQRQLQEAS